MTPGSVPSTERHSAPTSAASRTPTEKWPTRRCVTLGVALGLFAVTVIAVVTRDAVSAAFGGALGTFLSLLVAAPIWEAEGE